MTGKERFVEILTKYKNRPIIFYGDPDCDGLISLLLMTQFGDMLGKDYSYYVNEHRFHGFTLQASSLRGSLVIAADFAITEHEMQCLVDNDVAVLSTDHHDIQSSFIDVQGLAEGVVINNQYPFEPEEDRYLSGAGVFYELICSIYPDFKTKVRDALVGITLLSDIRPTEGAKAKKYLRTTYSVNTEEGYINYLITNTLKSDFTFGVPRLDRNFIDFTLSPTINSLLRFNKTKEVIDFILGNGLGTNGEYKSFQSNLLSVMTSRVYVLDMPAVSILAINDSDFTDYPDVEISDFIGLLCNDYKDKTSDKSTLGFVISNGVVKRASFRGKYDDVHYLTGFRHIDISADGHPNAFGIKNFVPTADTWVQINDLVTELESCHVKTINVIDITNLAMALNTYGTKVSTENCYVRDCYRTYFRYKGNQYQIIKQTYKLVEFTNDDYVLGVKPVKTERGVSYKYLLDANGEKVPKYIEYLVDGRTVKSFGVSVKDGLILPILERGYMQLYVKPNIN